MTKTVPEKKAEQPEELKIETRRRSSLKERREVDGVLCDVKYMPKTQNLPQGKGYFELKAAIMVYCDETGQSASRLMELAATEFLNKRGYEVPLPNDDRYIAEKHPVQPAGRPMVLKGKKS